MLAVAMLAVVIPSAAAAGFTYDQSKGSQYYSVISEKHWDLAPGVVETEQAG